MAAESDWDVTSLNSVPLSTTSDWEVLSNGDDCVYHSDDELLSVRSSPPLTRQRSSSLDSGTIDAAAAAAAVAADSNGADVDVADSDAEAQIERLRRQLRESQMKLQRAQAELESTHIEVADAVASNTELQRELEQQRERSRQQIVEMKANAEEQRNRINQLNRQLIVSSLALPPPRRRGPQKSMRSQRQNMVSSAVRSRPAKKWFASHNHRSQYTARRSARGQKVSKRRGNDRV